MSEEQIKEFLKQFSDNRYSVSYILSLSELTIKIDTVPESDVYYAISIPLTYTGLNKQNTLELIVPFLRGYIEEKILHGKKVLDRSLNSSIYSTDDMRYFQKWRIE